MAVLEDVAVLEEAALMDERIRALDEEVADLKTTVDVAWDPVRVWDSGARVTATK